MGKTAFVHFAPLRNCLANLPLALHGPLAQRGIVSLRPASHRIHGALTPECTLQAPQSVAIQLSFQHEGRATQVVLGWTGLPASVAAPTMSTSSRSAATNASQDRLEIDPQFAAMLSPGLQEGTKVSQISAKVGGDIRELTRLPQVNIEMLRDLPHATTVNVTPSSADDWEVLVRDEELGAASDQHRTDLTEHGTGIKRRIRRDVLAQPSSYGQGRNGDRMLGRNDSDPFRGR